MAFTKIQQVYGQTLPKLLTAKSEAEFDKLWNDFVNERQSLNFELVQQYRQNQLDTLKAKLAE